MTEIGANVYDVVIVGAGPSGLWTALELVGAGYSVALIEAVKRLHDTRNISNGFMGGSAKSNAYLFVEPGFGGIITDISIIERFVSHLQAHSSSTLKIVRQDLPKKMLQALDTGGVSIEQPLSIFIPSEKLSDIEWDIRKFLENHIAFKPNCTLIDVNKNKKVFELTTSTGTIWARKCVLGLGRGGGHWLKNIAKKHGVGFANNAFDLGIRLEFPNTSVRKYTQKSQTFRLKWGDYRTTAFSVYGSVEMENVFDIKTSNARSVQNKQTCYSSIGILKTFKAEEALDKVLNLVQIANILADGQLIKEPVSRILNDKSVLSPLPEFTSLKDGISKFLEIFPGIEKNCYLYAPEARLNTLKFEVSQHMEAQVPGLYIVGDMSGHTNSFVQAACSGMMAARHITSKK